MHPKCAVQLWVNNQPDVNGKFTLVIMRLRMSKPNFESY